MSEPVIQSLVARRIWDSRGRPTVEAEITLSDGAVGRGGAGVYDFGGAGELGLGDPQYFCETGALKILKLEFTGVGGVWAYRNLEVNSLTAVCSHIIRTSLDVMEERHF